MKIDEMLIGKLLFTGIVLASILVFLGGTLYLLRDGAKPYQSIVEKSQTFTIRGLITGITHKSPNAYILLGLMILILTQLIRVSFAAWIFYANKEITLTLFSLFVLIVLSGSLLINL